MDILPIIFTFSGGNATNSYHDNPPFSVHLSNNIAWAKNNVNRQFSTKILDMIHISQIVIHVLDGVIRGFMYQRTPCSGF